MSLQETKSAQFVGKVKKDEETAKLLERKMCELA
jgi:hypothetical protein